MYKKLLQTSAVLACVLMAPLMSKADKQEISHPHPELKGGCGNSSSTLETRACRIEEL